MRILWFNHRDPRHPQAGGSELHLFEIGRRLIDRGHSIDVYCERVPGLPENETIDGISFHRRGGRVGLHLLAPLICLLNARRFDLVIDDLAHAFPWFSPLFFRNVVAIVHHVHDRLLFKELIFPFSLIVYFAEKLLPLIYRKCPVIAVSESTKKCLIQMKMPVDNIHVIHNGISDFYKPISEKNSAPLVLYVGRVMKYKNIDRLITIFSSVLSKIDNVRMVIVGTGPEQDRIRGLVRELKLEKYINIQGFVPLREKIYLMSKGWVLIQASEREGWSLTCIEAAACGTPCVAYNVHGLRDSIKNGVTGLLVPYGDEQVFEKSLVKVLADSDFRGRMSENAKVWAKTFSWDVSTEKFNEFCISRL